MIAITPKQRRQRANRERFGGPCASCGGAGSGLVLHRLPMAGPQRVVVMCPPCHAGGCRDAEACVALTRDLLGVRVPPVRRVDPGLVAALEVERDRHRAGGRAGRAAQVDAELRRLRG